MLVYHSKLLGTPILSVQASGMIAEVSDIIVDPDNLKIIALRVSGPTINPNISILDISSIREYSNAGMVIDSADELVSPDDVVKVKNVLNLNFGLIGLKVETKKGTHLGKIFDYTIDSDSFIVQQIIVKRPTIKSFLDPELTIHRREIVEVNDYKVIVKDEEKIIKARAAKEDFVPNFVNPFRTDPTFAASDTDNPNNKN